MRIDAHTALFFDASCLIAASGSPEGGSGRLLSLCQQGYLRAVVSHAVLVEAERNVAKIGDEATARYHRWLMEVPCTLADMAGDDEAHLTSVNAKDKHVAKAALASRADFLLTLDKGLIEEMQPLQQHCQVLTPGTFIRTYLPQHTMLHEGNI